MVQLVTRVSDQLIEEVDRLVEAGIVESRSQAVRAALEEFVDRCRRAAIGRQIAEGYRRIPQDDDLLAWAEVAGAAMVEAEPW